MGVHGRKRESLTDASEYFVKSHLVKCLLLNIIIVDIIVLSLSLLLLNTIWPLQLSIYILQGTCRR